MCPVPNLPQLGNPRSNYRMIVKMEVDFVFPRERRVKKEVSDGDISIKGQNHIYLIDFIFFYELFYTPSVYRSG